MKVLCLIDNLGSGGAQRQLATLSVLLKKQGMDVSVLTYHPQDFFLPLLREGGVGYTCLESRSPWRRMAAIRRILRTGDHDVVLAFLDGPVLYAELAAIPWRHWGLVVSERNAVPSTTHSYMAWLRQFHRLADYITTNSHTNRLMVERAVPALKGRMVTIYNAVDLDAFTPAQVPRNRDARRFQMAVAASYWHQKNPALFIEGIALARKLLPEVDIRLDWYGRSPRGKDGTLDTTVYDEASRMVQTHGLQGCVRLNPDRSPIQEVYCDADAVALPSLYEGLPNTICEAMACGRPVLMSHVCDAGNMVQDGHNGFLFDPLSPEAMAVAICKMAGLAPEAREAMGANGRQMAERMFDPAVVAGHYTHVLQAAAARKRVHLEHWVPSTPESALQSLM